MATSQSSDRPLRRDAERNRQRILDAAGEAFRERGLDIGLDEIARHAGLGVGTVYRRFPDKEQLIDALFEARIEAMCEVGERALLTEDPWEGVVILLTESLEMQVADRGLKQLLLSDGRGQERVRTARERLMPLGAAIFARAHEAGVLRTDVDGRDMPFFHRMIGAVADVAGDREPELWRRYLALLLDGLRADGRTHTLPVDALDPAALQDAMSCVAERSPRGA